MVPDGEKVDLTADEEEEDFGGTSSSPSSSQEGKQTRLKFHPMLTPKGSTADMHDETGNSNNTEEHGSNSSQQELISKDENKSK